MTHKNHRTKRFAYGAVEIDGLDGPVDALERADEFYAFRSRHEGLSFLLGGLSIVVNDDDELVADVFRLLQVLDVSLSFYGALGASDEN